MRHVTVVSKAHIPQHASVGAKQASSTGKDSGYALQLAFDFADLFFLAKGSAGQKAQP